jgi:hypothetical protein
MLSVRIINKIAENIDKLWAIIHVSIVGLYAEEPFAQPIEYM